MAAFYNRKLRTWDVLKFSKDEMLVESVIPIDCECCCFPCIFF